MKLQLHHLGLQYIVLLLGRLSFLLLDRNPHLVSFDLTDQVLLEKMVLFAQLLHFEGELIDLLFDESLAPVCGPLDVYILQYDQELPD